MSTAVEEALETAPGPLVASSGGGDAGPHPDAAATAHSTVGIRQAVASCLLQRLDEAPRENERT